MSARRLHWSTAQAPPPPGPTVKAARRRRVVAVALCVCIAAALAACGGGDDSSSAPATTNPKPKATAEPLPVWAQRVCGAMGAWSEALQRLRVDSAAAIGGTDPTAARDALAKAFDDAEGATKSLLASLKRIGAAPTTGGAEAAAQLRRAVTMARDALATAADDARGLPVDSIEAFTAAQTTFAASTRPKLIAATKVLDDGANLPALNQAFADAPACASSA